MFHHVFDIKPSKIYYGFIITILLISIVICPIWWMSIPVGIYGAYLLYQPRSIQRFYWAGEGKWVIETQKRALEGVLRGDSTLTPWVSVLRFKLDGENSTKSYVLFKDSLAVDRYRQLMVIIRMY